MPANESAASCGTLSSTSGLETTFESEQYAAELSAIVISELREAYGIKYRKEKKTKPVQEKPHRRRIFNVALDKLELTNVMLANGGIAQVPVFVSDACQRILDNVHTEGLFRKAGSTARQREIRAHLEAGVRLGNAHHVIDVANVLKLFFRELPEPLLAPGHVQETLLRCLLLPAADRRTPALLLGVLLLPALALSTLTYFMQFLHTVSQHAGTNRMTSENLAIVFAPGLMPLPEIVPQRLESHCRVVRALIEAAASIGAVPPHIRERVQRTRQQMVEVVDQQQEQHQHQRQQQQSSSSGGRSRSLAPSEPETEKKKKKRRSGMFNGLRKIVGSAIGSTDDLDTTPELNPQTPCLSKTAKKRKVLDAASGFSAKKKKDVLALLPENGAMLPCTPMCTKNPKKSRLSLGGRRNHNADKTKATATPGTAHFLPEEPVPVMERRWSVVGAPWSRKKTTTTTAATSGSSSRLSRLDDIFGSRKSMSAASASLAGATATPATTPARSNNIRLRADSMDSATTNAYLDNLRINDDSTTTAPESDFVRISKSEYEAIKERVQAIETRISQEFTAVVSASARQQQQQFEEMDSSGSGAGPAAVASEYERTLEENSTATAAAAATDQLAKRLSRELKIRRGDGGAGATAGGSNAVIRSPSARKIGTMRRRSRDAAVRLSRNFSWHLGGGSSATQAPELQQQQQQHRRVATTMPQSSEEQDAAAAAVATVTAMAAQQQQAQHAQQQQQQQQRANLKRGRPNTVQTGLRVPSPTKKPPTLMSVLVADAPDVAAVEEQAWTNGEQFFADMGTPQPKQPQQQPHKSQPTTPVLAAAVGMVSLKQTTQENEPCTPCFISTAALNEMKTPMLPPRRPLNFRTPLTLHNSVKNDATIKTPMLPPRLTPKQQTPGHSGAVPVLSLVNKALVSPMSVDSATGRASIARLRSQNAGQVAAKARLFNAFVTDTNEVGTTAAVAGPSVVPVIMQQQQQQSNGNNRNNNQSVHQRRQSAAFTLNPNPRAAQPATQTTAKTAAAAATTSGRPSILVAPNVHRIKTAAASSSHATHSSPRKSSTPSGLSGRRSAARNHLNGIHRRQKLRLAKSPIKRASPMRLKHLIDDAAEAAMLSSPSRPRRPQQQQQQQQRRNNFHTAMKSIVNDSPANKTSTAMRHSPRLQAQRSGNGATF